MQKLTTKKDLVCGGICVGGGPGRESSGTRARPTFWGRGGGGSVGERIRLPDSIWPKPGSEGFRRWPRWAGGGGAGVFFRRVESLCDWRLDVDGAVIWPMLDCMLSEVEATERNHQYLSELIEMKNKILSEWQCNKNHDFSVFIIFIKTRFFNVFYFLNFFYFLVANFFILLNLLNSYIKRLLSDGFNMAAIGNSLIKSHSSQKLSCTL